VLEASGGVSLATARAIAETGVHLISAGALTHSSATLDVGLDLSAHLETTKTQSGSAPPL